MRYTPKKPIQFATLTKIALKQSSWRRGLMKRIEIIDRQFVYGKAGPKDAVLMSKPHMFTAEAQHDGSKEMQCTSKKFWFQTFNKDWNGLKTVIGEQGPRKLLKITRQQLALGQPDGRTPSIFASQRTPYGHSGGATWTIARHTVAPLRNFQSRPPNIDFKNR